jgi:glycerol-3-phosphate O-acyltransferase
MQPVNRLIQILLFRLGSVIRTRHRNDPFQSGFIRAKLLKGHCGFLGLVEKKGPYQRFVQQRTDPLEYLIRIQREVQRPVYLVPQLLFFSKKPPSSKPSLIDFLFGSRQQPGSLRRVLALFSKPDNIFSEVSKPLILKEFIHRKAHLGRSSHHLALILRRDMLTQINAHRQSITGPMIKSDEELHQSILSSERLQNYIHRYARRRNISLNLAQKEALGYLDEIAARTNPNVIQICAMLSRRFLGFWFDEISINIEGLQRAKELARKGPLIILPCHKSNFDSILMAYALYTRNMPCPHMFAGQNLAFWPLGPLLRRVGAFFVRRTFRGAVFYSKVFAEYVYHLLHEGHNIGVYIEGSRSRIGKLLPPQLGMLSILLTSYFDGACPDLFFVPVYIGYDRVPEEGSYLKETGGGEKRPESLLQVFRARKLLRKRFGKFYLRFHEPIRLTKVLADQKIEEPNPSSKAQNALCRHLGYQILGAIDANAVVTPQSLLAAAILNSSKSTVRSDQLHHQVDIYRDYLASRNVEIAEELRVDPAHAIEYTLLDYVRRKFIQAKDQRKEPRPGGRIYTVNPGKRSALEYYKNNTITHFVPAAFTALAVLNRDSFQFSSPELSRDYTFLKNLFQKEFLNDPGQTEGYLVRKTLKAFIDDGILIPHRSLPDTYRVTSPGYRKLVLFASFLKSFFEAYWIVLCYYRNNPKAKNTKKERLKKIQVLGFRMHKREEIDRIEAISGPVLDHADEFFVRSGIKGCEDVQLIDGFEEQMKRYMAYLPWR